MNICDLSNEDIVRIVTDIFSPNRIVNIKRHKRDDYYISCDIYTEWSSKDGNDKEEIKDEIELRDPFKYGVESGRLNDCRIETKNATCGTCKHYGTSNETCWLCGDICMTMYERKQE